MSKCPPPQHITAFSSVSTVPRRQRSPSTGRPEKRLLRNLPLTIIHVIPSPMVSMAPGMLMLPELAVQLETHGQEVLRDARRTAEEATEGSHPIRVDTEMVTAAVLPTLIDLSKDADDDRRRLPRTGRDQPAAAWICQLGARPPCPLPGRGHPR